MSPGVGARKRQAAPSASQKILEAARKLFVAHGYAATTNEMLAAEAGVALQTVYYSFRTKAKILRDLIDMNIGSEASVFVEAFDTWLADASSERDPHKKLSSYVKGCAQLHSQHAPLLDMLHRAGDADPSIAEVWRAQNEQWRTVQRTFVTSLRNQGVLAAGVRPQRAVDVCAVLLGPEMFCNFVVSRGWSLREWERWTTKVLAQELLPTTTAG